MVRGRNSRHCSYKLPKTVVTKSWLGNSACIFLFFASAFFHVPVLAPKAERPGMADPDGDGGPPGSATATGNSGGSSSSRTALKKRQSKCRYCRRAIVGQSFAEHRAVCPEYRRPDEARTCRHCGVTVANAAEHTKHWKVCPKKPPPRQPKPLLCSVCEKEKPVSGYSKRQQSAGASRRCKACQSAKQAAQKVPSLRRCRFCGNTDPTCFTERALALPGRITCASCTVALEAKAQKRLEAEEGPLSPQHAFFRTLDSAAAVSVESAPRYPP